LTLTQIGSSQHISSTSCCNVMFSGSRWRIWHRIIALIVVLPFLMTASTGIAYRWGVNVFGYDSDDLHWLLHVHEGSYWEFPGPILYTGFLASCVLFMAASGFTMMRPFWSRTYQWKLPRSLREFHNMASSFIMFLFSITAVTGVSYRWCRALFAIPKENVQWLLTIHNGDYILGLSIIYTALLFLSLLSMAFSGLTIHPIFRRCSTRTTYSSPNRQKVKEDIDEDDDHQDSDGEEHSSAVELETLHK